MPIDLKELRRLHCNLPTTTTEWIHTARIALPALLEIAAAASAYREKFAGALPYGFPIGPELKRLIEAVDKINKLP